MGVISTAGPSSKHKGWSSEASSVAVSPQWMRLISLNRSARIASQHQQRRSRPRDRLLKPLPGRREVRRHAGSRFAGSPLSPCIPQRRSSASLHHLRQWSRWRSGNGPIFGLRESCRRGIRQLPVAHRDRCGSRADAHGAAVPVFVGWPSQLAPDVRPNASNDTALRPQGRH